MHGFFYFIQKSNIVGCRIDYIAITARVYDPLLNL